MSRSPKITLSSIEAVAPDQASLKAARKLLNDKKWPAREIDADGRFLWGACQGSGASAYRMVVEIADLGAKCSCPSRKFPCKHSIALMWFFAEQPDTFTVGTVPEWVSEWHGRRRPKTAADADNPNKDGPKKSLAAASDAEAPAKPVDPERAKQQRERNRKARERSILQGLDELDTWLGDQVDRGLGNFASQATEQCRLLAQRLVDAKAGALASTVDELPGRLFRTAEAQRLDLLLETFGGLHLLAEAYRRQDALDPALRHDVRARVGWTTKRDELLADTGAERVRATWTVLSVRREDQPDRLVRFETYLATGLADGSVRHALLLDYVPVATAASAGSGLEPGTRVDAELVFYPSATPLRATLMEQSSVTPAVAAPPATQPLAAALASYDETLAVNPWLPPWPLAVADARVLRDARGCWLVDQDRSVGVPLAGTAPAALLGLDSVGVFGTFNGRELTLLAANSPLGPLWSAA